MPPLKLCIVCGATTDQARCPTHRRGTTTARGYGSTHQALRADYQRRMDDGERFDCWRCQGAIDPDDWCLGHDDRDRSVYRGPECPDCNYATTSRR